MESITKKDPLTAYLGMTIALGAWTMLFATLLFSYTVLRVQSISWPKIHLASNVFVRGSVNTTIVLLSSFFYFLAAKAFRSGNIKLSLQRFWLTVSLGVVFLILQMNLWFVWQNQGLTIHSSTAGALIYLLTGFHGIHILAGLGVLLWLVRNIYLDRINVINYLPVILVGNFWHFLTIVWIVMFVTIFIIK